MTATVTDARSPWERANDARRAACRLQFRITAANHLLANAVVGSSSRPGLLLALVAMHDGPCTASYLADHAGVSVRRAGELAGDLVSANLLSTYEVAARYGTISPTRFYDLPQALLEATEAHASRLCDPSS